MAFWYSVHLQRIQLSRHILHQNVYIKQLVALALLRDKQHDGASHLNESIDKSQKVRASKKQVSIRVEEVKNEDGPS